MIKERMDNKIKKVAAINDISCLGGASLTQIIPILSSMGVKTYPVPTVILSTHSGGYEYYTYEDLTDHMVRQGIHWQELGVKFDAIYSGFLGSSDQIVIVEDFIRHFKKEDSIVLVDPVMGDDGEVYSSIDQEIISEMRKLVSHADIVTPNLTEAFLLADIPYDPRPDKKTKELLLEKILALGAKSIVITSFPAGDEGISNLIYEENTIEIVGGKRAISDFPGTGDIFASVLLGARLNGNNLKKSCKIASDFVLDCINFSKDEEYSHRSGVLLEARLHKLYKYNNFYKDI